MADNFQTNSATTPGRTFSADDVGGVLHQRVKLQYGADGVATDVNDSTPLPVDDAGGSLTVDDGGSSLTVDGTVTADLSATDNAVLDAIAASDASIDGKITACDTSAVTVSADPARVRTTDTISAALAVDKMMSSTTELTVGHAMVSPNALGATAVIGKQGSIAYRIHSLVVISASDTLNDIYFLEEDGSALFGDATEKIRVERDGGGGPAGLVLPFNPLGWFKTTTANKDLEINLSANQGLICMVTYSEYAA